ncbi:MAG TPA: hypothetical protein VFF52_15300, partial [Isosphaeraceae bacterium]|nr:hypothetical protein [Isosphaeraceae bacterium]
SRAPRITEKMTGASLGALEVLVMITAMAASAALVALLLLARPGFLVSPKSGHKPAPAATREQGLLRQHNQLVPRLTKDFWRRYDHLVAKRPGGDAHPRQSGAPGIDSHDQ